VEVVHGDDVVIGVETAIVSSVAEQPLELTACHFSNWLNLGKRTSELDLRPRPHLIKGQEDQNRSWDNRPDDFKFHLTVNVLCLTTRGVCERPECVAENDLGTYENDTRDPQDDDEQVVDLTTHRGNVWYQPPVGISSRVDKTSCREDGADGEKQRPKAIGLHCHSRNRPPGDGGLTSGQNDFSQ